MLINNAEHTFVYIDPNQKNVVGAVEGTGESPASPLWDFPTNVLGTEGDGRAFWNDNVIYLVRRTSKEIFANIAWQQTVPQVHSLIIWGMPKPGEEHYDDVPEIARNAWGADDEKIYKQTRAAKFEAEVPYFVRLGEGTSEDPFTYIRITSRDTSDPLITPTGLFTRNGDDYLPCGDAEFSEDKVYYEPIDGGYRIVAVTGSVIPDNTVYEEHDAEARILLKGNWDSTHYQKHTIQFPDAELFMFYNAVFVCECSYEGGYGSDDDQYHYRILGSDSRPTNLYIDKVEYRGYDDFAHGIYTHERRHADGFIRINRNNWSHGVTIKNSTFSIFKYRNPAIHCGWVRYITLENVNFFNGACYDSRPMINWNNDYDNCPIVTAKNIHCEFYRNNDHPSCRHMHRIIGGAVTYATIDGFTFKVAAHQVRESQYENIIYQRPLIDLTVTSAGTIIKNVDIDMPWIVGDRSTLIWVQHRINYKYSREFVYPNLGQYNRVQQVNIRMGYNPIYSSGGNHGQNIFDNDGENEYPGIIRLEDSDTQYNRNCSTDFLISDIHIDAPKGIALRCSFTLLDLKNCNLKGACRFSNCMGKIGKIESWFPGYVLADDGGNLLYVKDIVCNKSNESYPYEDQHAVLPSYRSHILCTNSNITFMPSTVDRGAWNGTFWECAYICTNDKDQGNYTVRNRESLCRTWSVARVGAVNECTLKLYNTSGDCNRGYPLKIGGLPFKGITKSVQAGKNVAKIFVVMFGYNDPSMIKDNMKVRIKLPNGQNVFSQEGNWMLDTTTEWVNIDNGTGYKLTIPFECEEAGDVEFEYQWNWAATGDAATFLDPHPVIEHIS